MQQRTHTRHNGGRITSNTTRARGTSEERGKAARFAPRPDVVYSQAARDVRAANQAKQEAYYNVK